MRKDNWNYSIVTMITRNVIKRKKETKRPIENKRKTEKENVVISVRKSDMYNQIITN